MNLSIVAVALISAFVAYTNGPMMFPRGLRRWQVAVFLVIDALFYGALRGPRAAALRHSGFLTR